MAKRRINPSAGARRLLVAGVVGCVLGRSASSTASDGETEPVHLRFEREEALARSCPGRERFIELLRAQRPRLVLAPESTPARTFDVRVRREGNAIAGELVIIELDGTTSTRSMGVPDCPALLSALAVITAIAMDESPPAPHHEDVGERAPPTETGSAPKEPAPARRPLAPPPVERSASPGHEGERGRTGVGIGSELVLGALPRPTMGYRGYVERQHRLRSITLDGRLSLAFARAPLPDTRKLNVVVQTWTARAEGCGGRELFHTVSLEGCLGLTLGAYHSYSTHVANPRHDLRPWLTLDAGARLRWHLGTSHFFAETYGYVSYVTRPYTTVALDGSAARHEAPRGIGELGIGFGHFFEAP